MSRLLHRAPASKWPVVVISLAVLVSSCTETTETPGEAFRRGGTLRVDWVAPEFEVKLDPHTEYFTDPWEIFRCCLLRTLLSYSGRPTAEGGTELRPDLAMALPEVSPDGLTWTFRLKRGLRYGPPLTDTEIVADDIVRALEREAKVGAEAYRFYYLVIEGYGDFISGKAASITGLETPDDHTLVFHLTKPTGDLGFRLALPAAAPIPPSPQGSPLGVADGHENYGRFLVSSGPYSIEGADDLDFCVPASEQQPLSGFDPGSSLTLIRNPSWRPRTDRLRPAYADRIELSVIESPEDAAEHVLRGDADVLFNSGSVPQVPPDVIEMYRSDSTLADRLVVASSDTILYTTMNLAIPPFDDIHVRKALNYAIDKTAFLDTTGGRRVARHAILDSMENNLLFKYDPYPTPGSAGDLDAAKEEMAQSRYDDDGDGVCDASVCRDIRTLAAELGGVDANEQAELIGGDLSPLGITLDVRILPIGPFFDRLNDPRRHVPLGLATGWGKDFPNGGGFATALFAREGLAGCCNFSLIGATPQELREWGYDVTSVPSVEDKVNECLPLVGDEQVRCWAELDQQVMEQVVPWVPIFVDNHAHIVSRRVVSTSFDQFATLPALDRIALSRRNGSP